MDTAKLVAEMTANAERCQAKADAWLVSAHETDNQILAVRYLRYAVEESGGAKAWQLAATLVSQQGK